MTAHHYHYNHQILAFRSIYPCSEIWDAQQILSLWVYNPLAALKCTQVPLFQRDESSDVYHYELLYYCVSLTFM
jgi:hypothetical protein